MPIQGAVFTDIQPISAADAAYRPAVFVPNYEGLDDIANRQFVSETWDEFRIGQTIYVEIEIFLDVPGVTAIRLRPWWLRPQREFRAVGPGVTTDQYFVGPLGNNGVDFFAFGAPGGSLAVTHRLWLSSPKRLDIVPPASPTGLSYSQFLDDVWEFPLEPQADVVAGWSRRWAFVYPAHGYALAFTSDYVGAPGEGELEEITEPTVELSWATGQTHAIVQENIG